MHLVRYCVIYTRRSDTFCSVSLSLFSDLFNAFSHADRYRTVQYVATLRFIFFHTRTQLGRERGDRRISSILFYVIKFKRNRVCVTLGKKKKISFFLSCSKGGHNEREERERERENCFAFWQTTANSNKKGEKRGCFSAQDGCSPRGILRRIFSPLYTTLCLLFLS